MINLKDLIRKFPSFQQRDVSTVIDWTVEDTQKLISWINDKILTPQKMNDRIMMVKVKLSKLSEKIREEKKRVIGHK